MIKNMGLKGGNMSLFSNGGRPPKFKTPEELQEKVKEYFNKVPTKTRFTSDGTPYEVPCPTISGLVLFLGFCDRHSFYDYEHDRPEFSHTIKQTRSFIEQHYEELLQTGNTTGAIFALKNFGWKDKQEVEQTGTSNVAITLTEDGLKQAASKITDLMDSIRNDRKA